ncbi:MAG: FAD:protein FMN transferase [Spirochaetales bacterium]|jgi:thiamine biosynthesis lipoprotein|nr:FAD:protein FMN transferase [Spirochaetales bacterium]
MRSKKGARCFFLPGVCAVLLFSAACSPQNTARARTQFLLGTVCSISLYDSPSDDIFRKAFDRVHEIELMMSVTIEGSDISRVNAAAGLHPVEAADETLELVRSGLEFSRLSGGAFNIAVGPLVTLWGIGTERAAVPAQKDIAAALQNIDYNKVNVDEAARTVFLREAGMALDLGAIAKGYAADEAARVLREAGIRRGIIDFGGNILLLGTRPDETDWKVGIQSPGSPRGEFLGVLAAREAAVVSSGVYERFFTGEDGRHYHHILDTSTGRPVENGLAAVTVVTGSSRAADALSTTLFALGLSAGMELAEKTAGVEALFVTEDKKVYATSGMREIFRLTDEAYTLE